MSFIPSLPISKIFQPAEVINKKNKNNVKEVDPKTYYKKIVIIQVRESEFQKYVRQNYDYNQNKSIVRNINDIHKDKKKMPDFHFFLTQYDKILEGRKLEYPCDESEYKDTIVIKTNAILEGHTENVLDRLVRDLRNKFGIDEKNIQKQSSKSANFNLLGNYVDINMNYLGNDGILDEGKVYLVVNISEINLIQNNFKNRKHTGHNEVKSEIELPSNEVRTKIGEAVERSNSKNNKRNDAFKGDDDEGGFHEEGGIYGPDGETRRQVAIPCKPGKKADPINDEHAVINVEDRAITGRPLILKREIEGSYHIHPKGQRYGSNNIVSGKNGDASFIQYPSDPEDYNLAKNYTGYSYQIGAKDLIVNIISSKGVLVATIKNLEKFINYTAQ